MNFLADSQFTVQTVDAVLRQEEHMPKRKNDIGRKSKSACCASQRTFKPNAHKTAQKSKNIFYKCVLELYFAFIYGSGRTFTIKIVVA
jgi:hypothetical protein